MTIETQPADPRARDGGLWRRGAALAIDLALVWALLTLVAVVLYPATDGRIRMQRALIGVSDCVPTTLRPDTTWMSGPGKPAFEPNKVQLCTTRVLGQEVDRRVTLVQTLPGTGQLLRGTAVPVARGGERLTDQHFLELDWGPAALVLFVLFEAFKGATPGKMALGLRVVRPDGGRASFGQCFARNLLIYGPWLIVALIGSGEPEAMILWLLTPVGGEASSFRPFFLLAGATTLWILLTIASLVFQRPAPVHDRIAGTRVVRRTPDTQGRPG